MTNPKLSIVIVNWNTRDLLLGCLESIHKNPPSLSYQIIVVDNGSTDDSVGSVTKNFPDVVMIQNPENTGFARANNQAIKSSTSDFVILINSDTRILKETFNKILSFALDNERAAIIGGRLLNDDGSFQASYNKFPTLLSEILALFGLARIFYSRYFPSYPPKKSTHTKLCDWVGGAYMLVRREAIIQVGLMDERYFMYSEDLEWCHRMQEKGWQVYYCADSPIIHLGGGSASRNSLDQLKLLYSSRLLFFEEKYGPISTNLLRILLRIKAFTMAFYWFARNITYPNNRYKIYWELGKGEI
jgi:N-acetylglucosaminyl-diphospho-decaprenol L-rhamnosyltransferase